MLLPMILLIWMGSVTMATERPDAAMEVASAGNRIGRDSYLDAYKASHGVEITKEKIVSPVYAKPVKVTSDTKYGPPAVQTVYPSNTDTKYGLPGEVDAKYPEKYGGNKNEMAAGYPYYGVPHFHHHYNVQSEQITDPEPVDNNGHGGFDLKTVFKFIAKILVLKVIVKMVYIVMYLLFVPKINLLAMLSNMEKPDDSDDEDSPADDSQQEQLEEEDDSFFRQSKVTNLNYLTRQINKALSSPPK